MKKGAYVNRSVYQKVCEEKKKLLEDIRIISSETTSYKKLMTIQKWRSHFNRDHTWDLFLKGVLTQVIKDKNKKRKK